MNRNCLFPCLVYFARQTERQSLGCVVLCALEILLSIVSAHRLLLFLEKQMKCTIVASPIENRENRRKTLFLQFGALLKAFSTRILSIVAFTFDEFVVATLFYNKSVDGMKKHRSDREDEPVRPTRPLATPCSIDEAKKISIHWEGMLSLNGCAMTQNENRAGWLILMDRSSDRIWSIDEVYKDKSILSYTCQRGNLVRTLTQKSDVIILKSRRWCFISLVRRIASRF